MYKFIYKIFFVLSIFCAYVKVDVNLWILIIIGYFLVRVFDILRLIKIKIPFFEIFFLIFFIDNVFALTALKALLGDEVNVGDIYYLAVELEEYLPFAFLSMQAILIGYNSIKVPSNLVIEYVKNTDFLLDSKVIEKIIIIGILGSFITILGISQLDYVALVLSAFASCGAIALYLTNNPKKYLYISGIVATELLVVIKVGMFTEIIFFVIFFLLFYSAKYNIENNGRIKYFRIIRIILLASPLLYAIFFMQSFKSEYRLATWQGDKTASSETFKEVLELQFDVADPTSKEFYLPLFFRMNQAYLVSQTLLVVPSKVPYENGKTLVISFSESLLPRFLLPNKENAGGREKIKKYTNLDLVGSTSMNIGYLGESYVNFGKWGSVLFFFFFGITVAQLEKLLYNYSKKNPYIIIFIPILFNNFVGSGVDFLYLFNSTIKAAIIIIPVLYFFGIKKRNLSLVK